MIRWLEVSNAHVRWLGAVEAEKFQPTKTLADLVPEARAKAEQLLAQAMAWGMQPSIRSVGRTCAQQKEQYELGYSGADFCRGMHVLGHAIDLDLSPNACATYTKLGEWWEKQGGVWGGRWKQFGDCGDAGHFHYGFNGAQAVPTSVCPSGATLDQCVKVREEYLSKNLGSSTASERGYNLLGIGTIVLAGAVIAYSALKR